MQIFGYGRIRFSIGVAALALTFAIVAACTPTPAPATPKAAAPAPPIAAPKAAPKKAPAAPKAAPKPKPAAKAAPAPKAQPKDERDDTLKVGVRRLWANADPHFAGPGTTSATMFPSTFDSLVIPQEGALIPSLALEWRIIDPTTWEFTLRKGIKFARGGSRLRRRGGEIQRRANHQSGGRNIRAWSPVCQFSRSGGRVSNGCSNHDEETRSDPTESHGIPLLGFPRLPG